MTDDERRDRERLSRAVDHFIVAYAPRDGLRYDFERDLIFLVQEIYRDAQAPFVKAAAEAIAGRPMPPILFTTPNIEEASQK